MTCRPPLKAPFSWRDEPIPVPPNRHPQALRRYAAEQFSEGVSVRAVSRSLCISYELLREWKRLWLDGVFPDDPFREVYCTYVERRTAIARFRGGETWEDIIGVPYNGAYPRKVLAKNVNRSAAPEHFGARTDKNAP